MSDTQLNAPLVTQPSAPFPLHPRWRNAATMTLDNPEAMLICDGLLGMCLTDSGACEIGYLAVKANGDPELEEHQPGITVVAVSSSNEATILWSKQWPRETPTFRSATLTVTNPRVGHAKPQFLLKDFPGTNDFSKGVDLEHHLNGGQPLDIIRDAFLPRIQIGQGDFYSLLLTPEEYEAIPDGHAGSVIQLGNIAYLTAADLHCDPIQGAVVLDIDNGKETHSWSVRDRKIIVIIHNNCQDQISGRKCEEASPDGTTDFHHYYRAIKNPKIYRVNCKNSTPTAPDFNSLSPFVQSALCAAGIAPSSFCGAMNHSLLAAPKPFSTNPTPCGVGDFGEGGSLGGS